MKNHLQMMRNFSPPNYPKNKEWKRRRNKKTKKMKPKKMTTHDYFENLG